jgi:hypothetical protein
MNNLSEEERKAKEEMQKKLMVTTLEARLAGMREKLGWRSPVEMTLRMGFAWAFNVSLMITCCLLSVIYARTFNQEATRAMLLTWLLSYGVTFAIIEPSQILMIACLPTIFDQDLHDRHCRTVGRYLHRCRAVYNEVCRP